MLLYCVFIVDLLLLLKLNYFLKKFQSSLFSLLYAVEVNDMPICWVRVRVIFTVKDLCVIFLHIIDLQTVHPLCFLVLFVTLFDFGNT